MFLQRCEQNQRIKNRFVPKEQGNGLRLSVVSPYTTNLSFRGERLANVRLTDTKASIVGPFGSRQTGDLNGCVQISPICSKIL